MPGLIGLTRTVLGSAVLRHLPNLTRENYAVTSPSTSSYNCIAWAAGCTSRWWWPSGPYYWPPSIPREETVSAFLGVFERLGFESCTDGSLEEGFEKVALFVKTDEDGTVRPKHAARQLSSGLWTSKLGPQEDIEHACAEDVACPSYGNPVHYLKRRGTAESSQAKVSIVHSQ